MKYSLEFLIRNEVNPIGQPVPNDQRTHTLIEPLEALLGEDGGRVGGERAVLVVELHFYFESLDGVEEQGGDGR